MNRRVMWVLTHEVEYEGSTMMGVFSTAHRAMRAVDALDPPPSKAKKWAWIKWVSEPIWNRKASPGRTDYRVTRYTIDKSLL